MISETSTKRVIVEFNKIHGLMYTTSIKFSYEFTKFLHL